MEKKLNELLTQALQSLKSVATLVKLEEIEKKFLGKEGLLNTVLKDLKNLPVAEKPVIGKLANQIKVKLETEFDKKSTELKKIELQKKLDSEFLDITLPAQKTTRGKLHLISQLQQEVEDIFTEMGFSIMNGPEVESEKYNFECLNIPDTHPARDMQDTFFIDKEPDQEHGKLVLRTHTSPVQIRAMLNHGAPLKIVCPGRVFRYEATDASHDATFHQVEGLYIDKNISLSHLKTVMKEFLTKLFQNEVKVRFRPGYFPFVEPGLELDFSCLICNQKGCRVCKHTGWVEFMGAGMVHPNVLKSGNIDPDKFQGWAFGFGLTRLIMMKHKITDIRLLMGGDLRFNKQF